MTEASKVLDPEVVYLLKDRPQHDTAPASVIQTYPLGDEHDGIK